LKINPAFCRQDHTVAFNMGMIFYKNERNSEARSCLENALALNPGHAKATHLLGALGKGRESADMRVAM
jgi:Tetratricopeptide repeat